MWYLKEWKPYLVSVGQDQTIRVWKLPTTSDGNLQEKMQQVYLLQGHLTIVRCLTVWNGKVVSGSFDGTIRIWDVEANTAKTLKEHKEVAYLCVWESKNLLVSGGTKEDGFIRFWNWEGKVVHSIKCKKGVRALAVFNNLLWAGVFQNIFVYNDQFECIRKLQFHKLAVRWLIEWNGMIASAGRDSVIALWSIDGTKKGELRGHSKNLHSLAVWNGRLVSCAGDNTIRIWDPITHQCVSVINRHEGEVTCLEVWNGLLWSCSTDGTVRGWTGMLWIDV